MTFTTKKETQRLREVAGNPITQSEIERIEAAAKAATPGPWFSHYCHSGKNTKCWCNVVGTSQDPTHEKMDNVIGQGSAKVSDAEFIASVNPEVVVRLLHTLKEARGVIQYYADESSWFKWLTEDDHKVVHARIHAEDFTANSHGGKRAREFLAKMDAGEVK